MNERQKKKYSKNLKKQLEYKAKVMQVEIQDSVKSLTSISEKKKNELNDLISNSLSNLTTNNPPNTTGGDTSNYNKLDQYSKKRKDVKRKSSNSPYTVDQRQRNDIMNSNKAVSNKKRTVLYKNNPNYGKKHTPDIIFKMRQPRSEDGKKAIAESNKKRIGLPLSQTAKNKMSITRMGVKHSGQWQKGIVPWNKGKKNPYTEEVLLRMSNSHKGYKWGTESRKKLSETIKGRPAWNKGIPHSEETKRRISESGRGHIPWNKGLRVANV